MTDDTDRAPDKQRNDAVGLNDLAEDVFGLSIRGLATIRDLFVRPAKVFAAARRPGWDGLYTPSLRLVASLIALMVLLRIFWAAEDSVMYQNVLRSLETAAENDPTIGDPNELASRYFSAWALSFPFVYAVIHFLIAAAVRIWGHGTRAAVRFRLYPAALVPGLTVSIVLFISFPLLTSNQALAVSSLGILLAALLYGTTVFFGLRREYPGWGARVWRGGLFALLASIADIGSAVGAGIVGSLLMAAIRQGYVVPGL